MNPTDPDTQREWLLSKWERFTDDELKHIHWCSIVAEDYATSWSAEDAAFRAEITSEIARRQADAEAAEEDA